MIKFLLSLFTRKSESKRSSHWTKVREEHLKIQSCCQVCGSVFNLAVHHIRPFHTHPELELDPKNLITLCEGGHPYHLNCHFLFGHLLNWSSWNPHVIEDAKIWSEKIKNRLE